MLNRIRNILFPEAKMDTIPKLFWKRLEKMSLDEEWILKYSFWHHVTPRMTHERYKKSRNSIWKIGSFLVTWGQKVICDNIKIRKVRSSSMEYFTEWFWYPSYSFLGWKMFVCHGLNTRNKFKLLPSHYCYSVVIYHLKRNSLKKRG